MARAFFDESAKQALAAAARGIEERSSAEVVVVVRPFSGSYRHSDLLFGTLFAWATLWFQLFSPWEFSLESIFLAPIVIGGLAAVVAARSPLARRMLSSPSERRRAALTEARAAFVEKGVGSTSGRTGILVFLSLLERVAVVVADSGVQERAPASPWAAAIAAIEETFAKGGDSKAVAARIAALGDLLEPALPRLPGDRDELAEEVIA